MQKSITTETHLFIIWKNAYHKKDYIINDLKDLTHYGCEVEEQLQPRYNYMKFEDGVLMSAVWRKPNMFWTKEQETWMEKNWELIDPYSHQFIKENSLVRTLKKIQE